MGLKTKFGRETEGVDENWQHSKQTFPRSFLLLCLDNWTHTQKSSHMGNPKMTYDLKPLFYWSLDTLITAVIIVNIKDSVNKLLSNHYWLVTVLTILHALFCFTHKRSRKNEVTYYEVIWPKSQLICGRTRSLCALKLVSSGSETSCVWSFSSG